MKDFINTDISIIKESISGNKKKIVIITHRNPDGDAIGASLGLLQILHSLGHEITVITPNEVPVFLKWMSGFEYVHVFNDDKNKAKELILDAEIIFALDFNDLTRIKEFNKLVSEKDVLKIMIDHHPNPGDFAGVTISNTEVSSTAELIYYFIEKAGLINHLNKEGAECLFAGILTDTGCFKFNSSNKETFIVVSELLSFGFDKDSIYSKLFDNFSELRMRLFGQCLLNKMKILPEYKTGYIIISQEEIQHFDFQPGDSEGFVNAPLSIEGIRFSVLFTEREGIVKISFRSKGNFPANEIARKYFNGGGHLNAAGGESYNTLEKTIRKFESLLDSYKKMLNEEF